MNNTYTHIQIFKDKHVHVYKYVYDTIVYDCIYVHRQALPVGPLQQVLLMLKILRSGFTFFWGRVPESEERESARCEGELV